MTNKQTKILFMMEGVRWACFIVKRNIIAFLSFFQIIIIIRQKSERRCCDTSFQYYSY